MNDYIRVCKQCGKVLGEDEGPCSECGSSAATVVNSERRRIVTVKALSEAMLEYFEVNQPFESLLNLAPAFLFLFPLYYLCCYFSELSDVANFLSGFSILIEAIFYLSAVLCFARKKFVYLAVAFGMTSAYHILIKMDYLDSLSFNGFTILAIHILLFVLSVIFAKKNTLDESRTDTERKNASSSILPLIIVGAIIVTIIIVGIYMSGFETCSQCGTKVREYYDVYGEIWCQNCFY